MTLGCLKGGASKGEGLNPGGRYTPWGSVLPNRGGLPWPRPRLEP